MSYSLGVDISAETYTCSCIDDNMKPVWFGKTFEQTPEGWEHVFTKLEQHQIPCEQVRGIILENTGCYSERFCHWFYEQGKFQVYVEPSHRMKKALCDQKTDPLDSLKIAEYLFRYFDKVHVWQPPDEILDQVWVLLRTYEDFSRIESKAKNKLTSYAKKKTSYPKINDIYRDLQRQMGAEQRKVEKHLVDTLATNPVLQQKVADIMALKYTGVIMAAHLLVATNGFTQTDYVSLAKYLGVYPIPYTSGTSVVTNPISRRKGPKLIRKNLYITVMRLIGRNDDFKRYYKRKCAEGKKGRVAINNTINRFLRIVCGVLNSGIPYTTGYRSPKPD